MEVHLVTGSNQHLYEDALDQFFVERHKVYVDELNWVSASPDGRERDKYDTSSARYFLGLENDRVIAGSRLFPTTEPHLLSDVFADICTKGGVVSAPDVAEWTRGFISVGARQGTNKRIIYEVCHAIMEYALSQGISQIGGIQRTYWLTIWKWMGWKVHVHGEATLFEGDPWVPAYFEVSEEALAGARQRAGLKCSNLVIRGANPPWFEMPGFGTHDVGVHLNQRRTGHGGAI